MKKLKMDLQLFDEPTGHSITIYKDDGVSSAAAKNGGVTVTTNVAKDTRLDLYITLATGHKLKNIEYLSGDNGTLRPYSTRYRFEMPDEDVVLVITSRTGLSLTVLKDSNVDTMRAQESLPLADGMYLDGLDEGDAVIIEYYAVSGYTRTGAEVLSGDAKADYDGTANITMGETDAVVVLRTKPSNGYVVNENVLVNVNNHKLLLKKNTRLIPSKSGTIYDVQYADGAATQIDESQYAAAIEGLLKAGVLVKA